MTNEVHAGPTIKFEVLSAAGYGPIDIRKHYPILKEFDWDTGRYTTKSGHTYDYACITLDNYLELFMDLMEYMGGRVVIGKQDEECRKNTGARYYIRICDSKDEDMY